MGRLSWISGVITRVLPSKRGKEESECQDDAARNTPLATAGFEEGAGQEPRDMGSLWKPERQEDGSPLSLQRAHGPANNLIFALHVPFQTSDLQESKIINLCYVTNSIGICCHSSKRKLVKPLSLGRIHGRKNKPPSHLHSSQLEHNPNIPLLLWVYNRYIVQLYISYTIYLIL